MGKLPLKTICLVLLCAIPLFYVFPIPIPISKELPAVEIRMDDPAFSEGHTVTIEGTYKLYLGRADVFTGDIRFSGYAEEMADLQHMDPLYIGSKWPFDPPSACPMRFNAYDENGKIVSEDNFFATLYTTQLLQDCMFVLSDRPTGFDKQTAVCIVTGTSDVNEARQMAAEWLGWIE